MSEDAMEENLVRLADYRDRRARARRPEDRSARPRSPRPPRPQLAEPLTATVQALAPDVVAVAIPTALWPALSEWLSAQGVRVSGEL